MEQFKIFSLNVGKGELGISQMPGRTGALGEDVATIAAWKTDLVISMTPIDELRSKGADVLPDMLAQIDIKWLLVPVKDFGTPDDEIEQLWLATVPLAHTILQQGGRVLIHCYGGCGRSGMAATRIMVELGENADTAVARLREVRACAIETQDQLTWSTTVR